MTLYKWSQTSAANATADSSINYSEGQAPSSINDSARAAMAATAKYRDDIAGAIVTAGTSVAYTVSSYEIFDTLPHLSGQMIAFTPHVTNAATVTLNVDGLGAKPLRTSPGVELSAGTIIQGTPYVATYNNTDGAFYLHGFFGNPYNIPISAGFDYWGPTAPNSSFAFPVGQAISRVTYASLFGGNPWSIGTTYGAGDGSTTFNLPDKTGRISAMKEAVATRLTTGAGGVDGGTLGAVGGLQTELLTLAQLPTGIQSVNPSSIPLSVVSNRAVSDPGGSAVGGGSVQGVNTTSSAVTSTGTIAIGVVAVTSQNTGGTAHPNVQPTIMCNYILRII